ncbi:acyltransferase family protein [Roseateles sp. LKC17W]|uniref:Acyltransferase family protein n=1 Tax=Pelomonas margarita TaxID=3299031 RepID=A0ABW7FEE5_9BURK
MTAALAPAASAGGHAAAPARHAYNLGLQGMRGIAILLVLLNHAEVPGFHGGFIGVDVFFVISGYLIGGLLLRELQATGHIDLWAFYARRVRRLLPAAVLLILVVLLGIRVLYAPHEQDELLSSARASALYAANLWFASRPTDYFGGHTEANPLLHLWSLAVEEQFYLFWPLLMLAVCRGLGGADPRRRVMVLIVAASAMSLVACIVVSLVHFKYAFFLTPMRVWEFGAGMLVAMRPGWSRSLSPAALRGVTLLSLAALAAANLCFDGSLQFPGFWAVIPVAASVGLLLAAERGQDSWVGRLLEARPLRWVGDCSYSVYLWHWPVLIAAAVWTPTSGPLLRASLVLISVLLGWLSYRGVEQMFMRRLWQGASPVRVMLFGVGACLAVAGAAQWMRGHIHKGGEDASYVQASKWQLVDSSGCLVLFDAVDQPPCEFGDTTSATTMVLFGDSHAAQWLPALETLAKAQGWRLVALTKAVCPSVDTHVDFYVTRSRFAQCEQWRARMFERLERLRPQMIVMASSAGYRDVELARWEAGLASTVKRLQGLGSKVAYIRDTPHTGLDVPTCWARVAWWGWVPPGACTYSTAAHDERFAALAEAEARVSASLGAVYIDLSDAICTTERCPTRHGDTLMFRDRTHLSELFARVLAPQLAERLLPLVASAVPASAADR